MLTLVAATVRPAAGEDKPSWAKARVEFLRAFDANRPEERKDAIYDHLEGHDRPEVVKLLVRQVLAKDDEWAMVVGAAVEILGDLRNTDSVAALAQAARKGPVLLRGRVIEALGLCESEAAVVALLEALSGKELVLRILAADSLGRTKDVRGIPYLAEALKAPEWPLRAAAAAALTRIGSKDAVPHLILALGREKGRLREDISRGLRRLLKVRGGHDFHYWLKIYEKSGKTLEYSRGELVDPPVRPTVIYHGMRTWARRVVFVFDVSKSMKEEVEVDRMKAIPGDVREAGGAELERWKAMKTKIEWARAHLIHAIRNMAPGTEFGLITYNHGVNPVFRGKFVRATPDTKSKAIARVESLSPSGDTDLHAALTRAVSVPHGKDRLGRNLLDGAETIYFMTDGLSTSGVLKKGDRIAEEFERLNRRRRIRFHCIGIGMHDSELLSRLPGTGGVTGSGDYGTMD